MKKGNAAKRDPSLQPSIGRALCGSLAGLRISTTFWLLLAIFVYFGALSFWPLGSLLERGLAPNASGLFLGTLRDEWSSPRTWRALWNTLEASALSTAVALALGATTAFLVVLTDVRHKTAITFMLMLPLLIPPQIIALSWLELTDPSSPILAPFGLAPPYGRPNPLYSLGGVALVMGIESSTLVFLSVRAGLAGLPRDLVEAARVSGARPLTTAFFVVAPLAVPSVLAGGALAFVSSVGNFGAPAILGIPARVTLLTTLIYQTMSGFGPSALGEVGALALLLMLIAAIGLIFRSLIAARARATIDRIGPRLQPFELKRARPWAELALWVGLVVVSVLPLFALLATSLEPAVGAPLRLDTMTLEHYRFALFGDAATARAFANSFALAAVAAILCAAVAMPLAYFAVLRKNAFARALSLAAETPYAVPGTALAIGFIIAFLPPLPLVHFSLYDTIWIILAAYLARFTTLALRPLVSGFDSIDTSLEEAAQMVGARTIRRLVTVILPTVAPLAAAGALLVFVTAFHELTVSALLWSTGHETIGVVIFLLQYEGDTPAASALAAATVVISLTLAAVLDIVTRRAPGLSPWR